MRKVTIDVQPPYAATIAPGLLARTGELLVADLGVDGRRCYVITSANIRKHLGAHFSAGMQAGGIDHEFFEMGDGEQYKTLKSVETLAGNLVKRGADRKSVVIALGGGVVGD